MKFRAVHKLATYLMVISSLGALTFGGNLGGPVLLLVVASVIVSALLPERRTPGTLWQAVWTGGTFVALGLCIVEFMLRNELVISTVNFLLFLLINKLFNRRTGRDYLQLYVITFMMIVAGSVLNIGLSYALWFVIYVISTTWALILFHLRREMEENYLIKHSTDNVSERVAVDRILNSRRIVGGAFLLGTSVVSISIFLLAVGTFLFFPRVGSNLALGNRGATGHMTGFSERLALGGRGQLRDNHQIVMRVFLQNRPPWLNIPALRWRGMSFAKYDRGRWQREPGVPAPQPIQLGHMLHIQRPFDRFDSRKFTSALRQEIYLEPIGTNLLFAVTQPVALDLKTLRGKSSVHLGPGGELRSRLGVKGGRYVVYSDPSPPTATQLIKASNSSLARRNDPVLSRFYVRPQDPLPSPIKKEALRITAGMPLRVDKVNAVLAYLKQGFRYSRTLRDPGAQDPTVHFLFTTKAGHCEYFASSMVLLLRSVRIPARVVTGFYGGTYNDFGGYVIVRQSHAHAWVEVHFDGLGWITFDPTPPAGRPPVLSMSFWEKLRLLMDSLQMRWHRWVIDYNVTRQLGLFRDIKGGLTRLKRRLGDHVPGRPALGYLALALAVGLFALFFVLRRRPAPQGDLFSKKTAPPSRLLRPMVRLLKGLAKLGFTRATGQTLRELAATVDASLSPSLGAPGAQAEVTTTALVSRFYTLRYSGAALDPVDATALDHHVTALLKSLAAHRK